MRVGKRSRLCLGLVMGSRGTPKVVRCANGEAGRVLAGMVLRGLSLELCNVVRTERVVEVLGKKHRMSWRHRGDSISCFANGLLRRQGSLPFAF